ncbi:hypothetical protein ACP70R_024840 [Stipagrostis hirtigluma subsp. patula]
MAGQVIEAPMHQPPMPSLAQLPGTTNCKNDNLITTTAATTAVSGFNTTTAADMAYLQQLQAAAAEANGGGNNGAGGGAGGARGEQCPRCASHDTKFCYYNNYNTSQPRHFCRACRRYWTLGGSLRNVPIGGSTRKRPRLAHYPPAARRPTPPPPAPAARYHIFGGGAAAPTMPPPPPSSSSQGLLGSLFALGAAPLLEGRAGTTSTTPFDLGLAPPGAFGAGEVGMQMQGLGLRGGGPSPLLWPAGLLGIDGAEDTWKLPGAGAGATWPEFSAAAATPPQAGGLLQGGAQLM